MAKLVLIDGEGVAELSDATHWCLVYDQLPQTQRWLNGADISVTLQLRGSMWPYALTHQLTGQAVSASARSGSVRAHRGAWPLSALAQTAWPVSWCVRA